MEDGMSAFPSPERLARFSTRRPWLVVAIWAVATAAGVVLASRVGSVLTTSADIFVQTESDTANDLIESRLTGPAVGNETVVVQSRDRTVDDPAFREVLAAITSELRTLTGDVVSVVNGLETPGLLPVSDDGRTTLLAVTLAGPEDDADQHIDPVLETLAKFDGRDGFTVVTGGDGSAMKAFTEQSEKDLQTAEIIGIPIAMVILVIVFGALVASGLPFLVGLVSIIIAVGTATLIGQVTDLSIFLVNFVTTMGLAVGIDYALILVKRVREERANGLGRDDAIVKAGATAGRAVLFSGMAVIVALCGMILVPQSIFRSLGVGAIVVVAAAVLAAMTLLPAVLRLLGDRVNSGRINRWSKPAANSNHSAWDGVTRLVARHPVVSVVSTAAILIAATVPYFTIRLGFAGISTLPDDTSANRAFAILDQEFSAGILSPTRVALDGPGAEGAAVADRIVTALRSDSRFGTPRFETNDAGTLGVLSVPVSGDPEGNSARQAVIDLRERVLPAATAGTFVSAYVTGQTAESMDSTKVIEDYTIPVFAFVLGLSFIILLVVFRSIVVPLKAIVMNMLSVGAAYGLMVLVFQHGIGNELFRFSQVERIETWVPLFMFAVLFGLSMDYHVFLLTRIREHYEHTGRNTDAVIHGVRSTAGMITGAAAIMIAVFAGFAAGEMVSFQQMGFGLAVAVLLDATVVRMVLVPASMELLGARNWYLPRWLEWLPKVDVEGSTVTDVPPSRRPVSIPVLDSGDAMPGQ
jgi:RND superfamily putative drug exporter